MRFTIIQFPGSNCDQDCQDVLVRLCSQEASLTWHGDSILPDVDVVVLPGGFSYGDYLRTGAMASRSPIMKGVIEFANKGGLVLGICNGFQILCEAGLLPGALIRNKDLNFICEDEELMVVNNKTPFSSLYKEEELISMPIAHGEGQYVADEKTIKQLEVGNQIIFKYKNNPNGSINDIAGICNEKGNVLGLMPHPERASEALLGGGKDGLKLFKSLI